MKQSLYKTDSFCLFVIRFVCRGDPHLRRTSSNRIHQRTDVHHRRGGGGEALSAAARQNWMAFVKLWQLRDLFCSLVAGPHVPALDSVHYPGPSCGVVGEPETRGLHCLLQQERHLLHQQADRGQGTRVCCDLWQLTAW